MINIFLLECHFLYINFVPINFETIGWIYRLKQQHDIQVIKESKLVLVLLKILKQRGEYVYLIPRWMQDTLFIILYKSLVFFVANKII